MKLIIDIREHSLLEKIENIIHIDPLLTVQTEKEQLPIGDILLRTDDNIDRLIIERKSIADLLSSIKDGRYEEQSHRLKHTSGLPSHYVLYIIEGILSSITLSEKKIVFSAISSLSYFKGFSVIRTASTQETAEVVYYMADKIQRSLNKGIQPAISISSTTEDSSPIIETYSSFVKKVKKENINENNIGEIMLCQIPGIQSKYATAILRYFETFSNMILEVKNGTADFSKIYYECNEKLRKIPKSCGDSIVLYLQNI
jgi:ERCC4-type nuclease